MACLYVFFIGTLCGSSFNLLIHYFTEPETQTPSLQQISCKDRQLLFLLRYFTTAFHYLNLKQKLTLKHIILKMMCGTLFSIGYFTPIDLPVFIILLSSLLLVYFDWQYLAYPFIIWLAFFLFLSMMIPFNYLVMTCLILAFLTEMFPLKMGSGDWLYLSLICYSISFLSLIYCILIASLVAIGYLTINISKKKKEIPFLPFLFIGYSVMLFLQTYF